MRRSILITVALAVTLGWLGAVRVSAQATGAITGVVMDESGAVMPGVSLDVTNTATNQTRTAVTGSDGFYSVPLLQPGPYTVKAALQGFKGVTREGITVSVESTSRVDIRLTVGQREETITVTGASPLVETS
ncbi:MAG: carboxypeptidase-like regulatory domain-containing protein, partial [Acidobacteria bacterium]|nr:carboxypeptidase-like regulatory domain-containing protein [Acidobacteriota bacterium]